MIVSQRSAQHRLSQRSLEIEKCYNYIKNIHCTDLHNIRDMEHNHIVTISLAMDYQKSIEKVFVGILQDCKHIRFEYRKIYLFSVLIWTIFSDIYQSFFLLEDIYGIFNHCFVVRQNPTHFLDLSERL